MYALTWLIPALPFIAFLMLVLFGSRLERSIAAVIGTASLALSVVVTMIMALRFIIAPPNGYAYTQVFWTWIRVGSFNCSVGFRLDPLSLVMSL